MLLPSSNNIAQSVRFACALSVVKQFKVMKKLECWNAGTYRCYDSQLKRWNLSESVKADELWFQYVELRKSLEPIAIEQNKTAFF
jgi:hypothetical protein